MKHFVCCVETIAAFHVAMRIPAESILSEEDVFYDAQEEEFYDAESVSLDDSPGPDSIVGNPDLSFCSTAQLGSSNQVPHNARGAPF